MTKTGLRELRQNASDLVRQAEAGDTITITVSGRAVAELGPIRPNHWRRWDDITDIFTGGADPEWATERDLIGNSLVDPFAR